MALTVLLLCPSSLPTTCAPHALSFVVRGVRWSSVCSAHLDPIAAIHGLVVLAPWPNTTTKNKKIVVQSFDTHVLEFPDFFFLARVAVSSFF